MKQIPNRLIEVDVFRGIALIMVILFHFFFDLNYLRILENDLYSGWWLYFQRTAASLFIGIAGISLVLSERQNKEGYLHHVKRGMFLGAVALLITVATWVYPHDGFIMFGIIHFLAVCALIGPLFLRFRILNLFFALASFIIGFSLWQVNTSLLVWLGFTYAGFYTLDYFPVLPWFGVFLLGIAAGQWLFPNGARRFEFALGEKNIVVRLLSFLGRNTLLIYLIHQPIFLGILLLSYPLPRIS